jgi:hypothetical protein
MTPKEKAEDLFSTYRYALSVPNAPLGQRKDDVAKQCALIAIGELLILASFYDKEVWDYLEKVKKEIDNI